MNEANLEAKLVIQGTFECRDKDGNLIEFKGELPLEDKDDDQRSE
jgi:hypothetical protein